MYFVAHSGNQMYLVLYFGQTLLWAASAAAATASGVGSFGLDGTGEEPERITNTLSFHFTLSICWKEVKRRVYSTVAVHWACCDTFTPSGSL